jgi:glyoxylase I family protein
VVLRCRNLQSMFEFYTKVLGCTIDDEPTRDDEHIGRLGGALTHLRAGTAMIDLLSYNDESQFTTPMEEGQRAVAAMRSGGGIGISSSSLSDVPFAAAATSTLDHLFCLRIEPFDEEQIRQHFKQYQVEIVVAAGLRKGSKDVGPSVYLQDPEGNIVELKGPSSAPSTTFPLAKEELPVQAAQSLQKQSSPHPEPSTDRSTRKSDGDAMDRRSYPVGTTSSNPGSWMPDNDNTDQTLPSTIITSPLPSSIATVGAFAGVGGIVSTPCTRICRYNADFYNGQVCIGCFREAYEIGRWNSMTASERSMALLDAADRYPDLDEEDGQREEKDTTIPTTTSQNRMKFEGSISKSELLRQAEDWAARGRRQTAD